MHFSFCLVFLFLAIGSISYAFGVGLPNQANENIGHPVTFEFKINDE